MTDDAVDSVTAPRSHRVRFKGAIGSYQYVTYHHLRYGIDNMSLRGETFDKFFTRDYDPSQPLIRYHQSTSRNYNIRKNPSNMKMRC
jgi:hypothetical protein